MKWFAVFFILFFLLIGYVTVDYTTHFWTSIYYLWDKAKDLLLVIIILKYLWKVDTKQITLIWLVMALFLAVRLIWEIIALIWPQDINNPMAIFILFLLAWAAILIITFYPIIKKWQRY